ncbi:hypothetical protein MLD38_040614 [Melastoma candidum]|nr:hypothetical protein MLD38_040614 [Melastoma candidum]
MQVRQEALRSRLLQQLSQHHRSLLQPRSRGGECRVFTRNSRKVYRSIRPPTAQPLLHIGGFLPEMCKSRRTNLKRAMSELSSSGDAFGSYQGIADQPSSGEIIVLAPAESPISVTIPL